MQFLRRDRVFGVVTTWWEYVVYPVEDAACDVFYLLSCCWYDARDEIVIVNLEDIPKSIISSTVIDHAFGRPHPAFKLVFW